MKFTKPCTSSFSFSPGSTISITIYILQTHLRGGKPTDRGWAGEAAAWPIQVSQPRTQSTSCQAAVALSWARARANLRRRAHSHCHRSRRRRQRVSDIANTNATTISAIAVDSASAHLPTASADAVAVVDDQLHTVTSHQPRLVAKVQAHTDTLAYVDDAYEYETAEALETRGLRWSLLVWRGGTAVGLPEPVRVYRREPRPHANEKINDDGEWCNTDWGDYWSEFRQHFSSPIA